MYSPWLLRIIVFIFVSHKYSAAFVAKVPGSIRGSYELESGKYACPISKAGKSGDSKRVQLTVTLCSNSTFKMITCPSYVDPQTFTFSKGANAVVIKGNPHYFNTYGIARYYGKETCVTWMYIATDTQNRVIEAECRSKCFEKTLGPELTFVTLGTNSSSEMYYKFQAQSSSSLPRASISTVLGFMALFTIIQV